MDFMLSRKKFLTRCRPSSDIPASRRHLSVCCANTGGIDPNARAWLRENGDYRKAQVFMQETALKNRSAPLTVEADRR